MPRIKPLSVDELPDEVRPVLEFAQQTMGFTPNDVLTMAHWPELLQAMLPLVGTLFSPGAVNMELKRLVALITSMSGGCQYCVAHNAFGMLEDDIDPAKREAIWEYPTSPAFSDAERAALVFAQSVGHTPNRLTDAEYENLAAHFNDRQIIELAGVACLFAFLNRWNSTFNTQLEAGPRERAETLLGGRGWEVGPHA
ncbi:MAG: carboxymuconolactone decarboxylase family protein [Gammaproteobacteria bacterium]